MTPNSGLLALPLCDPKQRTATRFAPNSELRYVLPPCDPKQRTGTARRVDPQQRTAQRVIPNSGLRTAWSVAGQRKYVVIINSARPGRSLADGSALL